MLENIVGGFLGCLTPANFLAMLLSVPLGIIIGALPGFGAATGLIILLPLTYTFDPAVAFVSLTGVYLGAEYGGSISAILINTPGTGGAVVTCFDGHPMARKGKARDALLISNISSFSGGIVGGLVMLFFLPILAQFALKFGAAEIFLLAVIGLLLVGSISKGDTIKGIASAAFGVLVTCVGADAATGYARFDFDVILLIGGLPYIPLMLGTFSVPYLLNLALVRKKEQEILEMNAGSLTENMKDFAFYFRHLYGKAKMLMARSGLIGVLIGMIPGVGGAVATMVAYTTAKKFSKTPEEFGEGSIEGLAAPESSNNGLVGGSLIPVLALGIPGSPSAAIFMGAIFMHGMAPGPNFMAEQGPLVYILIISVLFCSIVQLLYGAFTVGYLANVLKIPIAKLVPAVIVVCSIGAYVVRGLTFDVYLFAGAGLLAYFFLRLRYNLTAFVLGMILGSITESAMIEALTISPAKGGLIPYVLTRPIALGMIILIALYYLYQLVRYLLSRKKQAAGLTQNIDPAEEKSADPQGSTWQGIRLYDVVASLVFIGVCAVLYSMTGNFPGNSSLFPRFILIVLAACLALTCLKAVFWEKAYEGEVVSPFGNLPWGYFGATLALWVVYLVLLTYVGFFSASLVFVFAAVLFFGHIQAEGVIKARSLARDLFFSVAFIVAAYFIFKVAFKIQTPMNFLP